MGEVSDGLLEMSFGLKGYTIMKKIILLLVLFVSVFLIGCGDGVAENQTIRTRRIATIKDINDRQIQDDSDEFWLIDRNSGLMEWNVYIGE